VLSNNKRENIFGQKAEKSRISHRLSSGGVEVPGQLMMSANFNLPKTKYKHSKIVFPVKFVALIVIRIFTELLQLSAQSLTGIEGTPRGTGLGQITW